MMVKKLIVGAMFAIAVTVVNVGNGHAAPPAESASHVAMAKLPDLYDAYAPPMFWGPPIPLRFHIGPATYTIHASPLRDDTQVTGQVTFYDASKEMVTRQFVGNSYRFRTGDCYGQPVLRFKAVPFGTQVRVRVE